MMPECAACASPLRSIVCKFLELRSLMIANCN
uniref:Uncharacterized protein n=1 Tax=Rhizophora mucronata TaxID=61149 RepID=A0A2P2PCQ6_RHIMU